MFRKKTTIVVGAGASSEAGLPIGRELKNTISHMLNIKFNDGFKQSSGDNIIARAIEDYSRSHGLSKEYDECLSAAWRIRDALPQAISIDNFIDSHQGHSRIEFCGKLAIVRAILSAERNSSLYFRNNNINNGINYIDIENTWFNAFWQLLTENCKASQLAERLSSVRFVVFNYDRCIEHFLYNSIQTYYGIDNKEAAHLVKGINIYHPYGAVGNLPWYSDEDAVEFGAEPSHSQLLGLAKQIKTFTEGTNPESSDIVAIRDMMTRSDIVLFLGFAFHRQNLELIAPINNKHELNRAVYFCTALGVSDSDSAVLLKELRKFSGLGEYNIKLRNDLSCSKLFREFWRSLSH